jgi:predicted AlkP superfamily phosphohydrolase/phosphomutase
MEREKSRVLVIGIDGATAACLEPMMERGVIPNLRRIAREGFYRPLRSTVPPISAAAWSTFITGKNPGKHGVLNFLSAKPAEDVEEAVEIFPGGFSLLNARSIRARSIWDLLSEAGKRIGVVNVPMTYPPTKVNGLMITGMLTPSGAGEFTYPPELAQSVGDYEIDLKLHEKEFEFSPSRLIERLLEIMTKRGETVLRLMEEIDWDFFMVVFTETDRLQHRFWHYLDPRHPAYYSAEADQFRPLLDQSYGKLDELVGRLIDQAGPEAVTMILSDHGFGPVAPTSVFRRELARQVGLYDEKRANWVLRLRTSLERTIGLDREGMYRYFGWLLPQSVLQRIERGVQASERDSWAKAEAYIVPFLDYTSGVYINRDNISQDYVEYRAALARKLMAVKDPDSGESIVAEVLTKEEVYSGEHVDDCPDLVFCLRPGYTLTGGVGRAGRLTGPRTRTPNLQGSHRAEGIVMMSGPPVVRASSTRRLEIADTTVTALHLLGLPIPRDMDGEVIDDALALDFLARHPVVLGPAAGGIVDGDRDVWNAEEVEMITDRLRDMGYLE